MSIQLEERPTTAPTSSSNQHQKDTTRRRRRGWAAATVSIVALTVAAVSLIIAGGGTDGDQPLVGETGQVDVTSQINEGRLPADLDAFEAQVATAQGELDELHRQVEAGVIRADGRSTSDGSASPCPPFKGIEGC